MRESPEAGGKKDPFHFSLRILTIAQGKDTCCKKRIPSPVPISTPTPRLLILPIPGRPVTEPKTNSKTQHLGKSLETAFPHPGSPPPPGQYCEAPSCSAWFPGDGPAVVGPGGPLRREGPRASLGQLSTSLFHYSPFLPLLSLLLLFCYPHLPFCL